MYLVTFLNTNIENQICILMCNSYLAPSKLITSPHSSVAYLSNCKLPLVFRVVSRGGVLQSPSIVRIRRILACGGVSSRNIRLSYLFQPNPSLLPKSIKCRLNCTLIICPTGQPCPKMTQSSPLPRGDRMMGGAGVGVGRPAFFSGRQTRLPMIPVGATSWASEQQMSNC